MGGLLSVVAILLVFSFFITSADSATFVLAMQSEGGSLHPDNRIKVVWGVLVSTIAAVLLRRGGLDTLQNVLIIVALPFSILLVLVTISLMNDGEDQGQIMQPQSLRRRGRSGHPGRPILREQIGKYPRYPEEGENTLFLDRKKLVDKIFRYVNITFGKFLDKNKLKKENNYLKNFVKSPRFLPFFI